MYWNNEYVRQFFQGSSISPGKMGVLLTITGTCNLGGGRVKGIPESVTLLISSRWRRVWGGGNSDYLSNLCECETLATRRSRGAVSRRTHRHRRAPWQPAHGHATRYPHTRPLRFGSPSGSAFRHSAPPRARPRERAGAPRPSGTRPRCIPPAETARVRPLTKHADRLGFLP